MKLRLVRVLAVAVLVAGIGPARPATAHDPDTSYTELRITRESIATLLRFDLEVLGRIAPLDADGDGLITRGELGDAAPAIAKYLDGRVEVSVDDGSPSLGSPTGIAWPAGIASVPAAEWAATSVGFEFQRPLEKLPEVVTLIYDVWAELGSQHTNLTRIEQDWAEPLEITFTYTEPDYDYFTEPEPSLLDQLGRFVRLGFEHIFLGYEHLLFLLAIVMVSRAAELVKIVAAFTVAHTLALELATIGWVTPPAWLVEAAIAATVVYIAIENLWRRTSGRWRLVFCFGLVHGFGFANVLREIELPASALARSLLGFNLGVELGQLAIVAALLPATAWLASARFGVMAQGTISAAIGLVGLGRLLDRALGLGLTPL